MLTFAGIPLLLDDGYGPDVSGLSVDNIIDEIERFTGQPFALNAKSLVPQGLRSWIDKQFPLEDLETALPRLMWPGPRLRRFDMAAWPAEPSFRLNTLYWPTGATRYSWFHGLITDKQLNALLKKGPPTGAQNLVFATKQNVTVTASMYALLPRPITVLGTPLYLLTLVDARYFWADCNTGDLTIDDSTTWANILDPVSENAAFALDAVPDDNLGSPHSSLACQYDKVGPLIDAVAASLGRVLVANLDGTFTLQSATEAGPVFNANVAMAGANIWRAGNQADTARPDFLETILPAKFNLVFCKHGCLFLPADVHVESVTAAAALGNPPFGVSTADHERTVHTTACAYFPQAAATASNADQLTSVALFLAKQFYAGLKFADLVWPGIVNLTPEAISDHILWEHSSTDVMTRLVAKPLIDQPPRQLFHSFGADPPGDSFWAEIDGQGTDKTQFSWHEVTLNGNSFSDVTGGLKSCDASSSFCCAAFEANGATQNFAGRIVRLWRSPARGDYQFNQPCCTLNIYSTNTQKWDTYDSPGYTTPYSLAHPVEFDVTRTDNSGGSYTVRQHTGVFPGGTRTIAWTSLEVLDVGDFDFVYGLSGMIGIDPNSQLCNPIHCWLQQSDDNGVTWTDINATHTDQTIFYATTDPPGAGCEYALASTFVTSAVMTLTVVATRRYRLWVKTDDDTTYQRWQSTNSYLTVRRNL